MLHFQAPIVGLGKLSFAAGPHTWEQACVQVLQNLHMCRSRIRPVFQSCLSVPDVLTQKKRVCLTRNV